MISSIYVTYRRFYAKTTAFWPFCTCLHCVISPSCRNSGHFTLFSLIFPSKYAIIGGFYSKYCILRPIYAVLWGFHCKLMPIHQKNMILRKMQPIRCFSIYSPFYHLKIINNQLFQLNFTQFIVNLI